MSVFICSITHLLHVVFIFVPCNNNEEGRNKCVAFSSPAWWQSIFDAGNRDNYDDLKNLKTGIRIYHLSGRGGGGEGT